jgi:hypothetical protein
MGQFSEAVKIALMHKYFGNEIMPEIAEVRKLLVEVKKKLFPELTEDAHWGITSKKIPEESRIAFDLEQVIRHRLAWDKKPEGGHTVDFHEPHSWSNCPLAKITKKKEVANKLDSSDET